MSGSRDAAGILFTQLTKLIKAMNDEQFDAVLNGSGKLAFVGAGSKVIQISEALELSMKHIAKLKPADYVALAEPGSRLAVLRKSEKVFSPIDYPALADELTRMDSEDEILRHLAADSRLKPADLTKIAKELGIPAPTGRPKPPMDLHIAQTLMSYRMTTPRGA